MNDFLVGKIRQRVSGAGVGTNAGVTVTLSAPTDTTRHYTPVGIQCSGDAAALVTIEGPASTILWRKRFAAAFNHSETFFPGSIVAAANSALLVKISASTANCEANIQALVV